MHNNAYRAYPGVRPIISPDIRLRPEMRLEELVDHWAAARNPSPKTLHMARRAVSRMIQIVGDLSICDINHCSLFDLRDALSCLPSRMTRAERQMPFLAQVRYFLDHSDPRPKLAPTSVGKVLNSIQALIGFAYGERWIMTDDVHNIPVNGHKPFRRRPFTEEEVRRIFALAMFIRSWDWPERPHKVVDETIRWLFLIGLMTGARIEEIGQLHTADVGRQDGIPFIAITETVYGRKAAKRLKSPSSHRLVPVHARLIDVGFLRFVERRRHERQERLFPDLERDTYKRYRSIASRRCNTIINRVNRDPTIVFHSFRHLFKDLCRAAGILESVNDQLTGHLPTTVGARCGTGVNLKTLAANVERLNFEFVDWELILRAAEP